MDFYFVELTLIIKNAERETEAEREKYKADVNAPV